MLGISFATFDSPPQPGVNSALIFGLDGAQVESGVALLAAVMFLLSMLATILLSMALNTVPSRFGLQFMQEFRLLITAPEMTMVSGMYLYIVGVLIRAYVMHGSANLILGVVSFALSFTILVGC